MTKEELKAFRKFLKKKNLLSRYIFNISQTDWAYGQALCVISDINYFDKEGILSQAFLWSEDKMYKWEAINRQLSFSKFH